MNRHLSVVLLALAPITAPLFAANVPRPSGEFALTLPDGNQLLLSKYKGKLIALEFLLTTCPHCQFCSSTMQKLYGEYGVRGFQPVGVAINEPAIGQTKPQMVSDYIKTFHLTFPVGFGSNESAIAYLQHPIMVRMMMPQLALIDKKFVIWEQHSGDQPFFQQDKEEANLRAVVEKMLNLKPASKTSGKTATKTAASPK